MTRFQCTCRYCGNVWLCYYFMKPARHTLKCSKCDDRNIRIQDAQITDVFGYGESEEDGTLDIVDESTD